MKGPGSACASPAVLGPCGLALRGAPGLSGRREFHSAHTRHPELDKLSVHPSSSRAIFSGQFTDWVVPDGRFLSYIRTLASARIESSLVSPI